VTDETKLDTTGAAPAATAVVDERLVTELVARAGAEGVSLTGEGGLLQQLTKLGLESSLEGEMDAHLGYGKHDPAGRDGGNSRNGKRSKTLLTEVGPVQLYVPRDREGSFTPQIVRKRQRRLDGVDGIVLSLSAKGLTTGEISAHLQEVYGASVSKDTIFGALLTHPWVYLGDRRAGIRRRFCWRDGESSRSGSR
jgi:putative transposase